MFKFDFRTIVFVFIIAVVGWTQWKIYNQEKTISDLSTTLTESQQQVSNLVTEVDELRAQIRIDRAAVQSWQQTTSELHSLQQGHQTEVKNALSNFQYQLAVNAKTAKLAQLAVGHNAQVTQSETPSYRIGDNIATTAIDGMWNAFATTQQLTGIAEPSTGGTAEESAGTTPAR